MPNLKILSSRRAITKTVASLLILVAVIAAVVPVDLWYSSLSQNSANKNPTPSPTPSPTTIISSTPKPSPQPTSTPRNTALPTTTPYPTPNPTYQPVSTPNPTATPTLVLVLLIHRLEQARALLKP